MSNSNNSVSFLYSSIRVLVNNFEISSNEETPNDDIFQPMVNVIASSESNIYKVNIIAAIPEDSKLTPINEIENGISLDENRTIWLQYSGVESNNETLDCRVFNIVYKCDEPMDSDLKYNLSLISFEYNMEGAQSANAIVVYDVNLDPETSRGTITTVRKQN